jgi:hypothetical protein
MTKTTQIRSITEFVAYIEKNCANDGVYFRGQRQDWPLLPKMARINPRFAYGARVTEERKLEMLKAQALPLLELRPETEWDWLALAQHHGIATRLLDWSTNPLAALWFAVEAPAEEEKPGVVWILQPPDQFEGGCDVLTSPFAAKKTQLFTPRHMTNRIVAQFGHFTAHWCNDQNKYVPLSDDLLYVPHLTKIIVPAKHFCDIRYHLGRFGVSAASIYPGLDGLCRNIEWLHSCLSDEIAA